VSDLDSELQLVHFCNAGDLEINVRLEVSRVLFVADKCLHFILEKLNVFE